MKIGFVGIGNMGLPMALNLIKSTHDVVVFDQSRDALVAAQTGGAKVATSVREVAEGSDAAETKSNVIGGVDASGKKLGLQALLAAEQRFGVKPRVLGVPELDDADVVSELIGVAQKLRAFVYASAFGCTTKEEAAMYRENFGAREVMVIWPDFTGWDTATQRTRNHPAVARALGVKVSATRMTRAASSVSEKTPAPMPAISAAP